MRYILLVPSLRIKKLKNRIYHSFKVSNLETGRIRNQKSTAFFFSIAVFFFFSQTRNIFPLNYTLGSLALHLGLILHFVFSMWTSQMAQCVKNLPAIQKTQEVPVQSLGQENPLEKDMATYSSILSWRIPWAEELGGLQSKESQRVEHNQPTKLARVCAHTHAHTHSLTIHPL